MAATVEGREKIRDISTGRPPRNPESLAAIAAFSAPATGSAITVTTDDAADLTTIGDGLEALRDEVATMYDALRELGILE